MLLGSQSVFCADKGTFQKVVATRYLRRVSGMSSVKEFSTRHKTLIMSPRDIKVVAGRPHRRHSLEAVVSNPICRPPLTPITVLWGFSPLVEPRRMSSNPAEA